jgi:NhaP-type Na+/H+ or K+/H+ antiporter
MQNLEPTSFVLLLTVFAVLMAASAVLSQASERAGVPVVLLFLALGMLAGREGIGRLSFVNYPFCFNLGTVALVLILFDGGFNTALARLREGIKPAAMLLRRALWELRGWLVCAHGSSAFLGWNPSCLALSFHRPMLRPFFQCCAAVACS